MVQRDENGRLIPVCSKDKNPSDPCAKTVQTQTGVVANDQ